MIRKLTLLTLLLSFATYGQKQEMSTFSEKEYDPLRPSRAAFYSAVASVAFDAVSAALDAVCSADSIAFAAAFAVVSAAVAGASQ